MSINVLAICGSLRAKSTNRGLLRYAQAHAPDGMKIHLADLLEVPFYNADLAEKPAAVKQLLKQIGEADALLFAPCGVGADQAVHHVGPVRFCGPHLGAIHNKIVTFTDCAGAQ